ncbi:unnamed protein product [Periconia digitata]|uniref:F-box domain-containing protein n=1 Tax=Periconia digitata TaxID=1303443 RepID=A0A9W4UC01_9PLEO|nr:unnamed protein product [Periconia digitata]
MADEAHIHRLPDELLLQIAGYFRGTTTSAMLSCLYNLRLVSKRFLPVAQDELYAGAYLPVTCGCHPCVNAAVQLLRTLLSRPDLAAKVKVLRFVACNKSITKLYRDKGYNLKPIRDLCLQKLALLGCTSKDNVWRVCLHNDVESAYAGVLLTLLPNLETLRFSLKEAMNGYPCHEPLTAMFGNALIATRALASLKKTIKNLGLSDIAFLREVGFTNVKSLDLTSVDLNTLVRLQGPKTIKSGRFLEDLTITMSIYSMETDLPNHFGLKLGNLFEAFACNNLKSLHVKLHSDDKASTVVESFYTGDLFRCIGKISTKLLRLEIDCEVDDDVVECEWFLRHCHFPIRSFERFPLLKHLKIPQQFLFPTDDEAADTAIEFEDLPPTLERLDILYPDSSITEWVVRYVDADIPLSLHTIALQCRDEIMSPPSSFYSQGIWAGLEKNYGINCLIIEDMDAKEEKLVDKQRNYTKPSKLTKDVKISNVSDVDMDMDTDEDEDEDDYDSENMMSGQDLLVAEMD